jgi:hypothetical protein
MSNTSTYITFSAFDYKEQDSLSSYALNITPFKFIPSLDKTYEHRVVWDFGDGTTSKAFSASKYYEFPGVYTVTLVVYDCNNNAMISSYQKSLTIKDYIPLSMNVETFDILLTESRDELRTETNENIIILVDDQFVCKNGKISGPFDIFSYFPPYQPALNIFCTVSGSNSNNYWGIKNNKFSHLNNFYSFYQKIYNYAITSYQYTEVDKIIPNTTPLFAKIDNYTIIPCAENDSGACYIGMSAYNQVYYKDDCIKDRIILRLKFDKTNYYLPSGKIKYINNFGIDMLGSVIENTDPSYLNITSNGLDGEGYSIDTFNINNIKFFDSSIPFVIKIKDNENFSVKNFNSIQLSALNISLSSSSLIPTSYYSISSLNYTLNGQDSGGAFRGYIVFDSSKSNLLSNVKIKASGTFISNKLSSYTLSGYSDPFNVYPSNYYDMYKKGENFNPEETLKNLRFQETMLDKPVLFENFLGSLLGNTDSNHQAIGVKLYEKITNFVENTQDVDVSEQEFLNSLANLLGYNNTNEETYTYPESIKRIMNLASVNRYQLIGALNKFRENFDIKGRTSKTEYGINLGNQINASTYVINVSTPIVALEKFSNTYTLLNTYQPLSSVLSKKYPLSTYSSDWGWPLVLPTTFNFTDIGKYYIFFEYTDQYDNTSIGGIIDFKNTKTTIKSDLTNSQLFASDGIFENMFLDALYQSTGLINQ